MKGTRLGCQNQTLAQNTNNTIFKTSKKAKQPRVKMNQQVKTDETPGKAFRNKDTLTCEKTN